MEDYKDIQELLKPRRDIKASAKLRNRVKDTVERKRRNAIILRNWMWGGISAGVAAAVLLLVLIPAGASAMSPKEILKTTLNTLMGVDFFEMEIEARTLPNDNFSYINPECDFVKHRISVTNADSVLNWRVDKGSRQAMHNAEGTYMWIDAIKAGWYSQNPEWNVLGFLSVFLSPTKVLESELNQSINDPTAEYTVDKDGQHIYLTVHSQPQGDFSNPYMLNTSVAESECYRRYVIDAETKKLISASVSIMVDGREVEMTRLLDIKYGARNANIAELPSDIEFINIDEPMGVEGLSGLNAREAASIIFNAFRNWNTDILGKVFDPAVIRTYQRVYSGAELINLGSPFKSGKDKDITFVPSSLRLRNGEVRQFNLALLLTPQNSWIVAGGL